MAVFGILGFLAIGVIAVSVDPWFTEGDVGHLTSKQIAEERRRSSIEIRSF